MNYPNYYPMYQYQQPQQQTQSNIFAVAGDDDIRRFPVAPGHTVTFKIEGQPIIVEKSLGMSQFDTPHYERYRMIKEDMPEKAPAPDYALRSDLDAVAGELQQLREQIAKLEKKPRAKKEDKDEPVE